MKKNKWLLVVFVITILVSVFAFIYYKGYEGMFDSFNKEQVDDTLVVEKQIPIQTTEQTIDTIYIYRVIVGSFKDIENAKELSNTLPFSDILETEDGWYRVSINTHFNVEDARIERDSLGNDVWVLKDFYFLSN
jgi:ABC-type lipoprotein release transport system permease subunit